MSQKILFGSAVFTLAAMPAGAAEIALKLQLPEIQTAQYERPYIAMWIEKADDTFVSTLSLWHMQKDKRGNEMPKGDRYMNTLREWWKQSGTTSQMPIDGLSSATRGAGEHELSFVQGKAPLNQLPAGQYQLVIEAVREVKGQRPPGMQRPRPAEGEAGAAGGDAPPRMRPEGQETNSGPIGPAPKSPRESSEVVRVNFTWPVKKATTVTGSGKTEVGNVSLLLKP